MLELHAQAHVRQVVTTSSAALSEDDEYVATETAGRAADGDDEEGLPRLPAFGDFDAD